MDPFVVMHALPLEPRCWFLGSGPSTFTSRWRERLVHRLGGLLPVWRGGLGIEGHVRSARAVVDAGAVFVQMPEGTVNGPPGRLGPFRPGAALIALRTGAPIVPLAMAGTEELYIGRRMASRVLPPTTAARAARRRRGTARCRSRIRARSWSWRGALSEALAARIGPVVEALYPRTVDPPGPPAPAPPAPDVAAPGPGSARALRPVRRERARRGQLSRGARIATTATSGGTTWIAAARRKRGLCRYSTTPGRDHRAAGEER